MSIEQIAFVIPPRIEAGLATGEFVRYGGVVRDDAGHIVTHLKEVPTPKLDKAIGVARKFAEANKVALVAGTVAAAALGGTAVAVFAVKRKKVKKAELRLQTALSAYMRAIVSQKMNLVVIDGLDLALAELRSITGIATSDMIDGEVLESLISYSRGFIQKNEPAQLPKSEMAQVVSLEEYLAEQRRIFDEAS